MYNNQSKHLLAHNLEETVIMRHFIFNVLLKDMLNKMDEKLQEKDSTLEEPLQFIMQLLLPNLSKTDKVNFKVIFFRLIKICSWGGHPAYIMMKKKIVAILASLDY